MKHFNFYIRFTAFLILSFTGIVNAFAGNSAYQAELTVYIDPTGTATVYSSDESGVDGGLTRTGDATNGWTFTENTAKRNETSFAVNIKTDEVSPGYRFSHWGDNEAETSTKKTFYWNNSNDYNKTNPKSITAHFKGVSYSVSFAGNGATSGSMSDQSGFVYGTPRTLNANAYGRAYTVTYNANEGTCGTSSATATYTFAGWKSSNNTSYGNEAEISTFSPTPAHNATVALTAQWTSASVTLPNATKSGAVLDGWYNGNVDVPGNKVGVAGDSYTPTANVTLTAKWINKYTPAFTEKDTVMMVGASHVGAFVFEHVPTPSAVIKVVSIAEEQDGTYAGKVVTYDSVTNTIYARNAGVAKIVIKQKGNDTIIAGESDTIIYRVYKYGSSISSMSNLATTVDNNVVSGYTWTYTKPNANCIGDIPVAGTPTEGSSSGNFYYTLSHDVTTDYTTGSPDGTKVIAYNAGTKTVTGKNKGTGTVHIYQKETYKFEAADDDFDIEVSKHANALKCAWNNGSAGDDWDENMNFDSKLPVKFSSTNTSGPAISVTQSPASAVATFKNGAGGANPDTIITNYREGSVTWTVSQAEDYKYIGDEVTCSVNVGTVYSNCYLVDDAPQREWSSQGNSGTYAFTLDQPGDTLFFDAERIDICVLGICEGNNTDWHIQYSTKMSPGDDDWTKLKDDKGNDVAIECEYKDTYYNGFKYAIPADARAIRFRTANVGSFGKKHIRNVKVGRKKWLTLENEGGSEISSITLPSRTRTGAASTGTFYIDYSTCADEIKLVSNNSHVKFSANNSTTYTFDVENGTRKTIGLTYTSGDAESIAATITIYTQYEHETLTVNAETKGLLSTTLEYIGADSYPVNQANMNATELFQVRDENGDLVASPAITLSSSNTSAINTVSSNRAIEFLCGADNVRITASYAGDDDYAAASNSGTFYHDIDVTKPNDVVTWNMPTAEDGTIHIKAKHDVPYSIATANTAIRFTTRNAAQLTANAGPTIDTLRTVAHSQTPVWLVATTAGSCTYNSIKDSIQITVEPCYHEIIWNQTFAGLTTAEDGTISEEYDLNAYAVDSNGVATNIDIIYSMPSVSFATLEGSHLTISGIGETTITATTATDNQFATVVYPKALKVRRYGEECESNALPESVAQEIAFENIVANTSNPTVSTYYLSTPVDSLVYYVRKYSGATTGSFELLGYDFATGEWRAMESGYGPGEVTTNSEGSRRVVHFAASDSTVRILKWESNADIGKIHWTHYQEGSKYILKAKAAPLKIFEVNRTSITREELNPVMVNTPFDTTITLRYCDKPHINYTYTGSVLSVTTDKEINNDCGDYGTYTFRFRGEFTKTGRYQDTIFFKTSAGDSIAVPFDLHVYTSGEFTFDKTEGDWGTSNKWSYGGSTTHGLLPTKSSAVTIEEPITISAEVEAYSVKIRDGATITILPGGGLTVGAGGIKNSSKTNLILTAGTEGVTKGKTGYLRISPSYTDTMPHAKVQMYSIGYYNMSSSEEDIASWQYIGTPIDFAGKLAKTVFTRSWIYSYQESTNSWVNNRKTLVMLPFVGYSTTQLESESGKMIEYPGQLIPNRGVVTIGLDYTDVDHGHNILANSFAAPIDITQFRTSDFINAERAIYIFNTGSKSQADDYSMSSSGDAAGQFRTIAIGSAAEMAEHFAEDPSIPTTIAPMQGFCVNAQGKGAQFKLDYERLVWNANYKSHAPTALRAPKHNADAAEEEEMPITGSMKMTLEANGRADNIYLLESERYIADFEDGYDAHKMESGTLNIFTVENEDKLAIDATNSIIGTRVGVRTGEETAYTITFSYVDGEQEWALYDAETNEMIDITNDNTYTFFAEPNSNITERFMIVEREGAPAVTTGNDKVTSDVRAHKFIKDSQLFILKNGVLYDATGARVK